MASSSSVLLNSANDHSDKKLFTFSTIFSIVGILIMLIPALITRSPSSTDIISTGIIRTIEEENGVKPPIFTYKVGNAEYTNRHFISSSTTHFTPNQQIQVFYNPTDPANGYIYDPDTTNMLTLFMRSFGGLFLGMGLLTIILKFSGKQNLITERIVGAVAAYLYGIPATLSLPILYYFFHTKPNIFFDDPSLTTFPHQTLIIGLIFTLTGLATIVATSALLVYLKEKNQNHVHFSKQP